MALKVLVTGSAGFIFSNFVIYALQHTDWNIVSIDKLTYAGSLLNVPQVKRHKMYIGDVCDAHFVKNVFSIERPDIVIHGAAESNVDHSIDDSSVFVKTNVLGTHSMLEAALNTHTPDKFINVSTDELYGSVLTGQSVESDMLAPRNPYSATKASADLMGQSYFSTYGLPVITTRCSNNFGPRQDTSKFIPKVITNIMSNAPIPLYGTGKQQRDWLYTKDKFHALVTLIESGVPGEIYNIGADQERTNLQVLDTIVDIMGGRELLEHVDDRLGHDMRYSVNSNKLKALGWSPQYNFESAILHTVNWYKANISWFGS